jgi:NADH-quinone oxidoreductase subunit C
MKQQIERVLGNLERLFGGMDHFLQRANLGFVTIPKEHGVAAVTHLRDHEGFEHLVLLTAVDWIEDGKFQLTYLLNNPDARLDLGVRVILERDEAEMESIHHLWKQAATYQRELHEMFGINFPGSPRVDQPFILEGWEGPPPYRRDFDTKKYSEETYFPRLGRESHDPTEYMKQKLYPDD